MGKPKIVVFGASSYIGGSLCNYLEKKNFEITQSSTADCDFLNAESVKNFFGSIPEMRYSIVFLSTINQHEANSVVGFEKNIKIMSNFIKNIDLKKTSNIIYFSSVKVYGNSPELPITETIKTNPSDWYSIAKFNCEWMLRYIFCEKIPVTILRIPGIYGAAPREQSVVGNFIKNIFQHQKVTIFGTGLAKRDYVFLGDLVQIVENLLMSRSSKSVQTLNIATGKAHSILEILEYIRNTLAINFDVEYSYEDKNNFDLCFDNSKLSSLLPSFHFKNLKDGISSYL